MEHTVLWFYGAALLALFPIVDPITAAISFAAMTQNRDRAWRSRQARLAAIYMVIILFVFQVLGSWILRFFAITLEAIRVAGGIMMWYAGIEMMRGGARLTEGEQSKSLIKDDVAFTPLAMPLLSGPGAIAVTLTLSARSAPFANQIAIVLAIATIAAVAYAALRSASALESHVGEMGRLAVSKVLGFLLLCMAVQFIMSGVSPVFEGSFTTVPAPNGASPYIRRPQ